MARETSWKKRVLTMGGRVAQNFIAAATLIDELEKMHQAAEQPNPLQLAPGQLGLPLEQLPEDVAATVLAFLDARALSAVREVNKAMRGAVSQRAEGLWEALCYHDFPTVFRARAPGGPEAPSGSRPFAHGGVPWHQTYLLSFMRRAQEELGNLSSTCRLRRSLEAYAAKFGGVRGLVSDLGYIEDERVARAVSCKRRAAMATALVDTTAVMCDFRRRRYHMGPLNFLPLRDLLDNPDLPPAELPPEPGLGTGFIGYAVKLVRLPPEVEPLRFTLLYTVFKDLMVFRTVAEAEACRRQRSAAGGGEGGGDGGDSSFYYCALDHPDVGGPAAAAAAAAAPHISHWGPRPPYTSSTTVADWPGGGGGGGSGAPGAGRGATVALASPWHRGRGGTRAPPPGVDAAMADLRTSLMAAQTALAHIRYGS